MSSKTRASSKFYFRRDRRVNSVGGLQSVVSVVNDEDSHQHDEGSPWRSNRWMAGASLLGNPNTSASDTLFLLLTPKSQYLDP